MAEIIGSILAVGCWAMLARHWRSMIPVAVAIPRIIAPLPDGDTYFVTGDDIIGLI
jgi:hypothetical protein